MYLERLSCNGIDTSKYYAYGGTFNPVKSATSDSAMPNCTDYALCRGYEASQKDKPFPIAKSTLGFGNAKDWYKSSPLPKTKQIVTGSIAVFDGKYGHVAFVERKIDDTHALISQSQYDANKKLRNYKYWEKRVVELVVGKATLSGVGALLGFLILPIKDTRTIRNTNVEQISIKEEMVNVRVKPNGDVVQVGCYAPQGLYNVLSKQTVDDYVWYEIDTGCWVRQGSWIEYYPIEDKEIVRLQEENKQLKKIIKIYEDKVLQIKEIIE